MRATAPSALPKVQLPDGFHVPALGLGTWEMGERARERKAEVAALKLGLDLGMTLVDTAEMYAEGGAEEVVADAIDGRRDEVFLVSKVYPQNAGSKSAIAACERSLARLRTDRLDLYLLHWRGRVPLAETVGAFERLQRDGKILRWGVSNFDVDDMKELLAVAGGNRCATDQVLHHLGERGAEWALAGLCRERRMPLMAYSPLGRGDLLRDRTLQSIAKELGVTPAQVALAWVLARGEIAIPKASSTAHVRDNRNAMDISLSTAAMSAIDAAFPPPTGPTPLAII